MIVVTAFYRFVDLPDYQNLKEPLLKFCGSQGLKGTILLAHEGINSTISGTREGINALYDYFNADPRFAQMTYKESLHETYPFAKLKVRLKKEIVALGRPDLNPEKQKGAYVKPQDWDQLIADPETVVVDTRNFYEYIYGTFKGALNPNTRFFRELPKWVEENLDPQKHKKVAMFCTGGIRCEKSTALLKEMGFDNVYHLEGGILQYLEDTKNANQKWEGNCFIFDDRAALGNELSANPVPCPACGQPLSTDAIKWAQSYDKDEILCRACRTKETAKT